MNSTKAKALFPKHAVRFTECTFVYELSRRGNYIARVDNEYNRFCTIFPRELPEHLQGYEWPWQRVVSVPIFATDEEANAALLAKEKWYARERDKFRHEFKRPYPQVDMEFMKHYGRARALAIEVTSVLLNAKDGKRLDFDHWQYLTKEGRAWYINAIAIPKDPVPEDEDAVPHHGRRHNWRAR